MSRQLKSVFLLLLFLCSACHKGKQKVGNTLRINIAGEPMTIDPRRAADPSTCRLIHMLYDGLTRTLPSGSVALSLAESVEVTPDRKQYKFVLKKTRWTNGSPVLARDFEYSWKSSLNPNFPASNAFLLYPIKNARLAKLGKVPLSKVGIKAINDRELIVQLEAPVPYFLELVAFCAFYPVSEKEEMQNPDWANVHSGTSPTCGSFAIDKWRRSRDLTLKKNRFNWNGSNIAIDKMEITFMENPFTALQVFEMGKIDWMEGNFASSDLIHAYHMTGKEYNLSRNGTFFTVFNVNHEMFNNVNMRKAFAFAIDREAIADNLLNKQIANRLIPPLFRRVDNNVDYFFEASPECANEYFERALYELGLTKDEFPTLTYYYPELSGQKQVAQALQNQWRENLGINVELQGLEMKLFLTRAFKRDFAISQSGIIAQYSDAMNFLERFQNSNDPKNYPGWESTAYNEKLAEALTIQNPKLRQCKYDEAEAILMQEMPIAPVHYIQDFYLLDESVQGVEVAPNGIVDFRNVKVKRRLAESSHGKK